MSDIYPPVQKPYLRNCEIIEEGVFPAGMHRVALSIEYNGAQFHGFQKQTSGVRTVQECLERALSQVADEKITTVCAGRTDAGVHGTNQVLHFDTLAVRPDKAWVKGVNAKLPDTISVRWAKSISAKFHARFSANNRTYRYVICNSITRPSLAHDQMTWERRAMNVPLMQEAAGILVGEHDFTSFRATQCQAKSPVRRIHHIHIVRRGDLVILEIKANAFLHHMVRNIVGVLTAVAVEKKPVSWVADVLLAKDRTKGGKTASPNGLHLVLVDYPEAFDLPVVLPGPHCCPEPIGGLKNDDES